jgi:hypothetical protein
LFFAYEEGTSSFSASVFMSAIFFIAESSFSISVKDFIAESTFFWCLVSHPMLQQLLLLQT